MTRTQFSPIRMTAATQDAAVAQALQIVGVSADEVSVEVISEDVKGVTVRVSPRRDDQPTPIAAPIAATEPAQTQAEETEIDSEIEAGDSAEMALQIEDEIGEDEAIAETETVAEVVAVETVVVENVELIRAETAPETAAEVASAESAPVEIKLADEATQERVRELAQSFLERMGLTAQASISDAPANGGQSRGRNRDRDNGREERDVPRAFLQIDGEDVGILIGKHGQTLQSFQYLLNVTLNNQMSKELGRELGNGDGVRVLVDAGGYRVKRGESLQQMAQDAATRAKRDRRAIRMEPMSAQERRLVHIALEGDSEISTSSEGREPLRHVVVIPAGAPRAAHNAAQSGFGGGSDASSGGQRGGFSDRSGNRGGFSNGGGFGNSGGNGGFNRRDRGR